MAIKSKILEEKQWKINSLNVFGLSLKIQENN